MSHSTPAPALEPQVGPVARLGTNPAWQPAFVGAASLLLWLEVLNHLRAEWTVNPQYSYGWSVPFLALFLLYRRWEHSPLPAPARAKLVTIAIAIAAALPLLPGRIISIANPDWRLLSWTLIGCAIVISLCGLNLAGGLPWVRHFGFPITFILVATPWPAQFEQNVVQGLMRADAAIVVQVLNAIGTLAIQRGNVIELSTGLVGIADACTGVRSLQSTLMISLFLGEYYRMALPRRAALVLAAAVLAFTCNLVRTLLLCLIASASTVDAIHTWHDSAGMSILLACIIGLWLLSIWMSKGRDGSAGDRVRATTTTRVLMPWRLSLALALWIGLAEICAANWYHTRSEASPIATSWSVAWPEKARSYEQAKVPNEAKELLRYDEGGGAKWVGEDSHAWLMYYFRWLPGRTAALFVKNHRPDICLPASGMTLRSEAGLQVLSIRGINLPFRAYRFESNGRNVDVFYCYWDGRSSYVDDSSAYQEDWTAAGRLKATVRGQREIGARMLELVAWGYQDEETARQALRDQLDRLIIGR